MKVGKSAWLASLWISVIAMLGCSSGEYVCHVSILSCVNGEIAVSAAFDRDSENPYDGKENRVAVDECATVSNLWGFVEKLSQAERESAKWTLVDNYDMCYEFLPGDECDFLTGSQPEYRCYQVKISANGDVFESSQYGIDSISNRSVAEVSRKKYYIRPVQEVKLRDLFLLMRSLSAKNCGSSVEFFVKPLQLKFFPLDDMDDDSCSCVK